MKAEQCTGGQGALEYLLLLGGAVVVAVIVIFLLIGIAGSTGNAANSTVSSSFQHIQGALDGGDQQASLCGNGVIAAGEDCDGADLGGVSCADLVTGSTGTLGCNADCTFNVSNC